MRVLTAPGVAGVAVVAFDEAERAALLAVLRTLSGRPFSWGENAAERARPRLAALTIDAAPIDEVLVVDRAASAGTADGGVELHLHGSMAVIDALRQHFVERPAAPWTPAGRLLRDALSPAQLDLALEQLRFESDPAAMGPEAVADAAFRARSRIARAHVEPCRLVFAGVQNAGKSTLFNRLLFRERALTGPLPGLTRDPVDEGTTLAGYPYRLTDTAGEGAAASAVDREAIARGQRLRRGAIVVLVIDASVGPAAIDRAILRTATATAAASSEPGTTTPLVVANKSDLPAAPWPPDVPQHLQFAAAHDDPATLRDRCGAALRRLRDLPPAGPVGGPAALAP